MLVAGVETLLWRIRGRDPNKGSGGAGFAACSRLVGVQRDPVGLHCVLFGGSAGREGGPAW